MKNLKAKHYSHYLKNIYETYVSGDAREESFYPYLKEFLKTEFWRLG